jgi:hypothetical protein
MRHGVGWQEAASKLKTKKNGCPQIDESNHNIRGIYITY